MASSRRVNVQHLNNLVLTALGLDAHLNRSPARKGVISASLKHAHVQEGITPAIFEFHEAELFLQIEPAHSPSRFFALHFYDV